MRRVDLDFAQHRAPGVRWLLLLLGLLAVAAVIAGKHFHYQVRIAAAERELRAGQAALARRLPAQITDKQLAAEWLRAITVAGELNRPWEKLFAIFEAQAGMPVALLSFEPDVVKGELVVTGEARDFDAMLDYYRMLQQQDRLSAVTLHTHQVNQQDKDKPIRFRITAKWQVKI